MRGVTDSTLDVPGDDDLDGGDPELRGQVLDLGDVERLLHVVRAPEWRVRFEQDVVFLRPLRNTRHVSEGS